MRIERVDGKRKIAFAKREQDGFTEVSGLCDDLAELNVVGAAEAASALQILMETVGLIEESAPDAASDLEGDSA